MSDKDSATEDHDVAEELHSADTQADETHKDSGEDESSCPVDDSQSCQQTENSQTRDSEPEVVTVARDTGTKTSKRQLEEADAAHSCPKPSCTSELSDEGASTPVPADNEWPIKYSTLTMAEAPTDFDFHAVLDTVEEDLLDDMDLVPVLNELITSKVFRPRMLRDLQEKYNTTTEKVEALLQLVRDGGYTKYDQLKKCLIATGQGTLVNIMVAAEKGPVKKKKPMTKEEKLLAEGIIEFYLENESRMPVAPLVEKHDAELTSFYVRPPMMAYNKPNAFGQVKQSTKQEKTKQSTEQEKTKISQVKQSTEQEKTKISSYRELLFSDNGTYKRTYLTADAGMGKTSFSKMLARTWCQAHKPDQVVADKFSKDDLDTMRNFDFLFLIKLREYQGKNMCCLDDMIVTMLQLKLPRASSYTKPFVEQVLFNRQCLIIVDGLDEWSHPEHTPSQALPMEVIPHTTRLSGCCSVLTTTRPWKLSEARLSGKDIDRQVEISELDKTTARELESRAITFLKENQESSSDQVAAKSNTKTVTDFENSVPKQILGHILYIPFVLLQIICLWFGNSPIGKSLCEVYSNIIELTLTRWLVKTDSGHTVCKCKPSKDHGNIKLKCMENNRHCQRYMPLLLKIGQLAFLTLFNVIREKSLLFDKEQVLRYLSKEELEQCLAVGLLSQVKDTTSLAEERLQLYFPHKTLHEFFCTLFIATNWNNANTGTMSIKQTISNKFTSVSDILEMSEVFVFVCGLNPEVYSDISRHLATIVSTEQSVIDYRNRAWYPSLLMAYQRMQISCFLECTRNQHPECKIVIEDMFLPGQKEEDEQQALVKILSNSACSLKSLDILFYDETKDSSSAGEIVRILEQTEFSCLERLDVLVCGQTWLQNVLTSAAHTLKYLNLGRVSLTDDVWSAISTLNNLRGLHLYSVQVSRDSMIVLTLPLLTEFTLADCDLRDNTVTLSPEMTSLKTITLDWTTENMPGYRELFLSISKLPQHITVELEWIDMTTGEWRELLFDILGKLPKSIHVEMRLCRGTSEEEWGNIVDDMKASPAFCVTQDTVWDIFGANITFDTVVV